MNSREQPKIDTTSPDSPPDEIARRFRTVRRVVEEVQRELPEEQKGDRGERRRRVTLEMAEQDRNLAPAEQAPIIERMKKRYIDKYEIRSDSRACVDAVHGVMPPAGTIRAFLRRKGIEASVDGEQGEEQIWQRINEIQEEIGALKQEDPTRRVADFTKALRSEDGYKDPVSSGILDALGYCDEATGELAQTAADQAGASFYLVRFSRLAADFNRSLDDRKIDKKAQSAEFGQGPRMTEDLFLKELEQNHNQGEGAMAEPFLHISVHGIKAREGLADIILANGMKNGKMPCDPELAIWLAQKLEEKLAAKGLVKSGEKEEQFFTVGIATEGKMFSGPSVNVESRFGNEEKEGLGEFYQRVQMELIGDLRLKYGKEMAETLAEVLQEFEQEFRSGDDWQKFVAKNRTAINEQRAQGNLAFFENNLEVAAGAKEGEIVLPVGLRKALGIKLGDEIKVGGIGLKASKPDEEQQQRKNKTPIFSRADWERLQAARAGAEQDQLPTQDGKPIVVIEKLAEKPPES